MNLKLASKRHLVDNVWAFDLQPDKPLSFKAGQYIRVELIHDKPDGEGTKRWFTNSAASFEKIMRITTRITESTFKQALSQLAIGESLQLVEEPDGDFVWQDSDSPLILVAGGIGITPYVSMLKQRLHEQKSINARLIYANRTQDIPFQAELDQWATEHPELKIDYLVGKPLNASTILGLEPELNQSIVYLSGPEPMVEAIGEELQKQGLSSARLKQDFFPNYDENNY